MPFLSPTQHCQSTEGKNITYHGLAYPKLTWGLPTLSLAINSSWLPWGGVPVVNPLIPVPQSTCIDMRILPVIADINTVNFILYHWSEAAY